MPLDFIPNVGSQLDRALRALFIAKGAVPQSSAANGGIFLTMDSGDRKNPLRTILSHDAQESVRFGGTQMYRVTIMDQFDATIQPGQTNAELNRIEIDRQVGKMMFCMEQSLDGVNLDQTARDITDAGRALAGLIANGGSAKTQQDADNNRDMAYFTCLFVTPAGQRRGHPENAEGSTDKTYWAEVRMFDITVAPQKIEGYSNVAGQ